MAIGFFTSLITIALIVAGAFFSFACNRKMEDSIDSASDYHISEDKKKELLKKAKSFKFKSKVGVGAACLGVLLFLTIPFSFHQVNAGEIAVVKHLGKATHVRTAGTYFDFWVTEKYEKYDAKVRNLDVVTMAYSKDAQTMDITMTVQYQIDSSRALQIANQYGSMKVVASRIQSVAIEKAKAVLSAYSAMNIIETRSQISPEVEKTIRTAINDEYCVNITTVVLTNIDFSDAFEKTVEDKMIAEQEKLKAQYEKETAIVNAEKELEVAKLAAEAKIAAAKADAEAQIEIAKAEAMSVQLKSIEVARALGFNIVENEWINDDGVVYVEYEIDFAGKTTDEIKLITDYLQYVEYLSKWNGELPNVVTDGSANVVIPSA